MRSFRRSPAADHLVHLVELPELSRRRRQDAARNDGRAAQVGPGANSTAPAAHQPGLGRGPNGMHTFRARRDPSAFGAPASAGGGSRSRAVSPELRELDVPRPQGPAARASGTAGRPAPGGGTGDAVRIELLERRLAKLARLLSERDEQLQLRTEQGPDEMGLASVYTSVQGLRGQSEEAQRKRSLMSSIFEANRKLRERMSSPAQDAE